MNKFVLFFLLFTYHAYALIGPEAFESNYLSIEDIIEGHAIDNKFNTQQLVINNNLLQDILEDRKNLVTDTFAVPDYFKPAVTFWFGIYTQYSSQQVVIHDKENVEILYKILDFSQLYQENINIFASIHLQSRLVRDSSRKIKRILNSLGVKKYNKLSKEEVAVYEAVQRSKTKIPKSRKNKKRFFRKLAKNVRVQTGQRDMIYKGVVNSLPFIPFIYKKFESFKLPKELLAIALLESSFNTEAYSKAGATGVWQFIKYTGNIFMPKKNRYQDYRNNPFISSIAAMQLLRENKTILSRWDLAVTAYNAGTKHLVRAKRKFKKIKNISLEYILENYRHPHLGFASKNYYAEFLALVHVLAYKEVIYPLEGVKNPNYQFKANQIKIYVSKCPISPHKIAEILKVKSPDFLKLNKQFRVSKKRFSKGTIIVSDIKMPSRYYEEVSSSYMRKVRPKKWNRLVRKKSCR